MSSASELKFHYNKGGAASPSDCRHDLTFPNPARSTWEFVSASDENGGINGFSTPVPSIKQNVKRYVPEDYTVYLTCAEYAQPILYDLNWGEYKFVAVITIATLENPDLCTALESALNASLLHVPSLAPTAYPTLGDVSSLPTVQPSLSPTVQPSISPTVQPIGHLTTYPTVSPTYEPCWVAKVMDPENDPISSFPICNMWRGPDNNATCYTDSTYDERSSDEPLLRISFESSDVSSGGSVKLSPDCKSDVIFPSNIVPWTYTYQVDSEHNVGGFHTPMKSIRILTTSTYGDMFVYVTCGSVASLRFSDQWCNKHCSIITITSKDAPELCAFLATGNPFASLRN